MPAIIKKRGAILQTLLPQASMAIPFSQSMFPTVFTANGITITRRLAGTRWRSTLEQQGFRQWPFTSWLTGKRARPRFLVWPKLAGRASCTAPTLAFSYIERRARAWSDQCTVTPFHARDGVLSSGMMRQLKQNLVSY